MGPDASEAGPLFLPRADHQIGSRVCGGPELLDELQLPREQQRGEDRQGNSRQRAEAEPDGHHRSARFVHRPQDGSGEDDSTHLVRDKRGKARLDEQPNDLWRMTNHSPVIAQGQLGKS